MTDVDALATFDFAAFFAALNDARRDRDLGWCDLAEELWDQSALDEERQRRGPTWAGLAEQVGCTRRRLTNLRTARMADLALTMRVTQWLSKPAAEFIHPASIRHRPNCSRHLAG